MRKAAKIDVNQPAIVKALRAIGAHVYYIKEPVDLMVGFANRTVALEVKNPKEGWRLTKQQKDFFAIYSGEAYIVETVAEAIQAVSGKITLKGSG